MTDGDGEELLTAEAGPSVVLCFVCLFVCLFATMFVKTH